MYQIVNEAGGTDILLYSLIEGMSALKVIEQVKGLGSESITVRINSDGGDIFEALAMYNYLKSTGREVKVYVDGLAASAASIVACAGMVYMPENAMMMLHNPSGSVVGDSEDMRALAEVLDKVGENVAGIYAAKSGQKLGKVKEMMRSETWMSAREAKALGFCDEVLKGEKKEPEVKVVREEEIESAVRGERERLRELDSLMTPSRAVIINRAKYEELRSANDIALELLRVDQVEQDSASVRGLSYGYSGYDRMTDEIAGIINRKRGY